MREFHTSANWVAFNAESATLGLSGYPEKVKQQRIGKMSKVMIIGAGGVGSVVAQKCAQAPEVFSDIVLASRTVKSVKISNGK